MAEAALNAEIISGMFDPDKVEKRRAQETTGGVDADLPPPYPADAVIILGQHRFRIAPLKIRFLRQLEADGAAFLANYEGMTAAEKVHAGWDRMLGKIGAAIKNANPDFDLATLEDLDATYPQVVAASRAVDRITGLISSGEAQGSASSGETSTAS